MNVVKLLISVGIILSPLLSGVLIGIFEENLGFLIATQQMLIFICLIIWWFFRKVKEANMSASILLAIILTLIIRGAMGAFNIMDSTTPENIAILVVFEVFIISCLYMIWKN